MNEGLLSERDLICCMLMTAMYPHFCLNVKTDVLCIYVVLDFMTLCEVRYLNLSEFVAKL